MKPRIELHTRLHEGIYKSSGGGQDRVVATFSIGPRSLYNAVENLHKEREDNTKYYGNVGRGSSWLEYVDESGNRRNVTRILSDEYSFANHEGRKTIKVKSFLYELTPEAENQRKQARKQADEEWSKRIDSETPPEYR